MPSSRELLKLAAADEAKAARLESLASRLREQARQLRAMAAEEEALSSMPGNRSMLGSKMELQSEAPNKRVKIAAKMSSDSEAKKALLEAGITARDVAKELHVGHSTVNAWCTGARSIPRHHANQLRNRHKIPVSVWSKLAD